MTERGEPEQDARSARPTRGSLPTPWGIPGTLYGIAATYSCWIVAIVAMRPLIGDADELAAASFGIRYGVLIVLQSVFVAVPLGALWLTRARPAALGLRVAPARGAAEAALCGALLFAFTWGYDAFGRRFLPNLAERALEEQERQLAMLEGPAVLLWLFVVVLVPVMEETFFRGFVFAGLRGRLDFAVASGLSAAFFALFHGMPFSVPPLFAVGLGTAVLFERYRSIWPCAIAHGAFNLFSLASDALG